jgi:molybdopterin-guanine dinucleotide biosynthesis protein A
VIGTLLAGYDGGAALLDGRPLASYPAEALRGVCETVALLCAPGARLPELPGTERWEVRGDGGNPLGAVAEALERAAAPVLVCAADMPYVTPDACRTLLGSAGSSPAVVATAAGELEPAFGLYAPAAADALRSGAVEELDPVRVALPPALLRRG